MEAYSALKEMSPPFSFLSGFQAASSSGIDGTCSATPSIAGYHTLPCRLSCVMRRKEERGRRRREEDRRGVGPKERNKENGPRPA